MKEINLVQGSKEWLDYRQGKIMATDMSAILEYSNYKSRVDLWHEKVGLIKHIQETAAMQRGTRLEPIARKWYEDLKGEIFEPIVAEHDKIYYLGASFDGISVDRKRAVEIKCGNKTFLYAEKGVIFEDYLCQVQQQMLISELECIDMLFYHPDKQPIVIPVYRDDRFINRMLKESEEFWFCVENFILPKPIERFYEVIND